jgi:CBS domain-containing protein
MRVREIMTAPVHFVRNDTPVYEVARLMSTYDISGVPVLDADDRLAGIVTELDLIIRNGRLEIPVFVQIFDAVIPLEMPGHLSNRLRHMLGTSASDVMTHEVHSTTPETQVEDLVHLMVKRRVNPVPVLDDGRLVGIVSRSALIHMMATDFGPPTAAGPATRT